MAGLGHAMPAVVGLLLCTLAEQCGAQVVGCGSDVQWPFTRLCDRTLAWGIVLESIAAAGIVICFILAFVLLGSIPFIKQSGKKDFVPVQVLLTVATMGLYGLTFAFIVMNTPQTCPTRRFLFGVLFAICFSCLITHAYALISLNRGAEGHSPWKLLGIVALLSLVQVIINVEWLITTMVRPFQQPCLYMPMDFVMALIYVMVLIFVGFVMSILVVAGKNRNWRKHGVFMLITLIFSVSIWIVWIVIYVRGIDDLERRGYWDDPVLGIALLSNATAFLFFYIIPEVSQLNKATSHGDMENHFLAARPAQNPPATLPKPYVVENRAFALDEPNSGYKSDSPLNGHHSNPVYQPTPMSLMMNGRNDHMIPRATYNKDAHNAPTVRIEDTDRVPPRKAFLHANNQGLNHFQSGEDWRTPL
uniref:G-protein coupled receptor family C group 5 member C-like isoform X1 n=1 Tax=Petromyzon marinus TaxID=7757 RepID=A0AAJ7U6B1_PETMA|nr:G-protein coupled receptor family C group 5 member C-like isoform X1 [Petromyzon marinus]XP_032830480.1 G-protein coupled receptor family C group 5 member C-like isoform X1 [Petromyzon marinus]